MRYLLLLCSLLIGTPVMAQSYCDRHSCKEPIRLVGTASWYGKAWQGRKMANGRRFDMNKLTIACWGIPLGTRILVLNLENSQTVVVEVTDRGPEHRLNRVADLSATAAERLGYRQAGLTQVMLILLPDEISTVSPQVIEIERDGDLKSATLLGSTYEDDKQRQIASETTPRRI